MSIVVRDMEMPETCEDCPFHVYHSHYEYVCKATPMLYPMNLANCKGIRKDWCPLSEVPEPQWIPCSERLPEEDRCLGGSGRQFSDEVLVSVANYDDEDIWTYISQTIDGEWALELPSYCEIIAWMPLPEPYKERREE